MRGTPWERNRRARSPLPALLTLLAIAALTVLAALVWPENHSLSGRGHALDGDTLRIGETRIRLMGFDAVELDQTCHDDAGASWPCGREARTHLADLLKQEDVRCTADGRDRYRRVLARCKVAGDDIGDRMVRAGWAVADLEYALPLADARLNRRGIWSGRFDDPADWRRNHGREQPSLWDWLLSLLGR